MFSTFCHRLSIQLWRSPIFWQNTFKVVCCRIAVWGKGLSVWPIFKRFTRNVPRVTLYQISSSQASVGNYQGGGAYIAKVKKIKNQVSDPGPSWPSCLWDLSLKITLTLNFLIIVLVGLRSSGFANYVDQAQRPRCERDAWSGFTIFNAGKDNFIQYYLKQFRPWPDIDNAEADLCKHCFRFSKDACHFNYHFLIFITGVLRRKTPQKTECSLRSRASDVLKRSSGLKGGAAYKAKKIKLASSFGTPKIEQFELDETSSSSSDNEEINEWLQLYPVLHRNCFTDDYWNICRKKNTWS